MFRFEKKIELKKKKIDLLTVGELLIDMISADYGNAFQGESYNKFFGGSPSNIAINARRLGINSQVVASVGKDGLGDFLISQLKNSHVGTECIDRVDYSTSLVLVTKSTGSPIPIFYRGADFHIYYTPELEEALKNSKIIHFSTWPISMEPARSTMEKIIEVASIEGILICFDPNYHEMLWEKGHDGIKYIKKIISRVDIIKPSEDDAERLFGKDTPENQIHKFLELGAKLVIMTLGKDGAIVSNGVEEITFDTLATEVVDTTGAGDAFWSGFYTGLSKEYSIKESLKLGFAVSAYKLKYIGAVVNLPSIEEIKDIYNI